MDLLTAQHTFVNERLALHYGIPNVRGDASAAWSSHDPTRWGLLGKGAVLMGSSYPNRTSPVLRGAWCSRTSSARRRRRRRRTSSRSRRTTRTAE